MNGETSWEQRMAQRAAERRAVAIAAEEAEYRANDPHRDHHSHLRGTSIECSCGEFRGVTCVAFNAAAYLYPDKVRCRICGEPGVVTTG